MFSYQFAPLGKKPVMISDLTQYTTEQLPRHSWERKTGAWQGSSVFMNLILLLGKISSAWVLGWLWTLEEWNKKDTCQGREGVASFLTARWALLASLAPPFFYQGRDPPTWVLQNHFPLLWKPWFHHFLLLSSISSSPERHSGQLCVDSTSVSFP